MSCASASSTARLLRWPLTEERPVATALRRVDGDQVPGHAHLVQADAGHAIDVRIEPRVMVAKEADAWAHATDEIIEPCGLARPVEAAPVSREHDARRRIVGEQQIETTFRDQPV